MAIRRLPSVFISYFGKDIPAFLSSYFGKDIPTFLNPYFSKGILTFYFDKFISTKGYDYQSFLHKRFAKFSITNRQHSILKFYIESIPSSFLANTPIIYEITATDKEIIAIVAKFLRKGSSFATDM